MKVEATLLSSESLLRRVYFVWLEHGQAVIISSITDSSLTEAPAHRERAG
ncbi:MAG TPA: hypothetical protein VF658_19595 [Pyrinomonadaceae bacterium]|jgi:hypothetical protein